MGKDNKGFEIDLVVLARDIFRKKYYILLFSFFLAFIVVCFSYLIQDEYESKTTLYSNTSSVESSATDLLKNLGGIELPITGSADDLITKELILQIMASNNFLLTLSGEKIMTQRSDTLMTVSDFLQSGTSQVASGGLKFSLMDFFKSMISSEEPEAVKALPFMKLGYAEIELIQDMKDRVEVGFQDGGFIELTVMMPDPLSAASFAQNIVDYLKKQVVLFKTEKLTQDLGYVERQYERAKKDYEDAQTILAEFDDMNQNIIATKVKNQREELNLDLRLKSEVYLALAKRYEQLRIDLRENTPLFLTLEPVYIPEGKSNTTRKRILILSFGVGIILSIGYVAFRPLLFDLLKAFK